MRKEVGGMELCHFYNFNLAMLEKQDWNLLTDHDAIVIRVFKSKYFSQWTFLGAQLGDNPSLIWHSIYTSRVVINEGSRWWL